MNRRHFLLTAAAFGYSSMAFGQAPADASIAVMNALSQAFWFRDGNAPGRVAYVFEAPWCPYCKQAFLNSRTGLEDVELRWIAFQPKSRNQTNWTVATNLGTDPSALEHSFNPAAVAPDADVYIANAIRRQNFWAKHMAITLGSKARLMLKIDAIPDFIWRSEPGKIGTKLSKGIATDKNVRTQISASGLAPTPDVENLMGTKEILLARSQYHELGRASGTYYATEAATGYALPDDTSILVEQIPRNAGLGGMTKVADMNGRQWIELQLVTDRSQPGAFFPADTLERE